MYAKPMKKTRSPWLTDFGRRLKSLRLSENLTTVELAKRIGVTDGAIRMWETGQRDPGLEKTSRIAKALNVSVEELTGAKPIQAKPSANLEDVAELIRAYGRAQSVRQAIAMYILTDKESFLASAMTEVQLETRMAFERAMIQFGESLQKSVSPPSKDRLKV